MKKLKQENETLLREKEALEQSFSEIEKDHQNQTIAFVSDNIGEKAIFQLSDIIVLQSADNYVEIAYREETDVKKRIIRSTLKSIQSQLKPFPGFLRCHRTAIVNRTHIQGLTKKFGSYSLKMRDFEEDIPVSRQYLFKVKDLE